MSRNLFPRLFVFLTLLALTHSINAWSSFHEVDYISQLGGNRHQPHAFSHNDDSLLGGDHHFESGDDDAAGAHPLLPMQQSNIQQLESRFPHHIRVLLPFITPSSTSKKSKYQSSLPTDLLRVVSQPLPEQPELFSCASATILYNIIQTWTTKTNAIHITQRNQAFFIHFYPSISNLIHLVSSSMSADSYTENNAILTLSPFTNSYHYQNIVQRVKQVADGFMAYLLHPSSKNHDPTSLDYCKSKAIEARESAEKRVYSSVVVMNGGYMGRDEL